MAKPADKTQKIRDFQSLIMGTSVPNSIRADMCASCGQPAVEFETELAAREFTLSGLCQRCQNEVFAPPDEDEDDGE